MKRGPSPMQELIDARRPGCCAWCDEPMDRRSPRQLVHRRCRAGWERQYWRSRRALLRVGRTPKKSGVPSRYSEEVREEMRAAHGAGASTRALGKRYGCSSGYVSMLLQRGRRSRKK